MGNKGKKQDEEKASYWHQRNDDDGFVEFRNSSDLDQIRTVKALTLSLCMGDSKWRKSTNN